MHITSISSSNTFGSPLRIFLFLTLGTCVALLTTSVIFGWFQPHILEVRYAVDGKESISTRLPIETQSVGTDVRVLLTLRVPKHLTPSAYDITVDDCLMSVLVDGASVASFPGGLCDSSKSHRLTLPLLPGIHQLTFIVRDTGGELRFHFAIPYSDALSLLRWLIFFVVLTVYLCLLRFVLRWSITTVSLIGSAIFAGFLRLLYIVSTPYFVRVHEWDRHVEYLRYVHDFFRMPPASGGWEFYQPPLYYFLGALWWRMSEFFFASTSQIFFHLQILSFLLSLFSVVCLACIAFLLVRDRRHTSLFLLLMSLVPGILFFSSQIGNDALIAFFGLLLIALCLFWHRRPSTTVWYGIVVIFSCAVLTKLSAFVLLPFVILCIVSNWQQLSLKTKHLWCGALLFIVLVGWYPVVRLGVEQDSSRSLALGAIGMNPQTRVDVSPVALTTFNPVRVLQTLYVDPVSSAVDTGYFPEYFFKSAFFGEYQFSATYKFLHFVLLLFAMIVCVFSFYGIIVDLWHPAEWSLSMIVLLDSILLAAMSARILLPFSPLQDFRFSIFLVVPLAYYFFRGVDSLNPSLRRFALSCAWALVCVEAIFILKLAFDVAL